MRRVDAGERRIERIAEALHRLTRCRCGTVTLLTQTSVTTVTEPTALSNSHVLATPSTENGAAAVPFLWITPAKGSIDFNHPVMTLTDCTFRWSISNSAQE